MDLKEQLEKAKTLDFIPFKALHRLIDAKSVTDYFCFKNVKLSCADSEEIIQKAHRLFAIHVLLDQGCVVQEYLSKGHGDKNLPYFKISDIPEIGGAAYRSRFYRKQWQIPTILQPTEHRTFPAGFIPPITYEDTQLKYKGGKFGNVYKVRVADGHLKGYPTEQPLALKAIRKLSIDNTNTMMREVQTLQARRHEHIAPLISSWTGTLIESECEVVYLNLLFPWARMDLEEWLYRDRPPWDWEGKDQGRLKEYIYHSILSISSAVVFVHREIEGLISSHHDIKPANILLFDQTWKLADFGRAHLLNSAQVSDTEGKLGTYTYQPPEYRDSLGRKAERRHGRAFDVWSLGCITIELVTVAVYGWKDQRLSHFREKRIENQIRPKRTPDGLEGQDDSFSNNMNVVRDWTDQLVDHDGSSNLRAMLKIAETMMIEEESLRYLSWEVYLDLYELLHPNKTIKERETETEAIVQPPNAYHGKREHNPLRRAVEQKNMPRIKCLLKKGWAGHPVDLPSINSEVSLEIHRLFWTARWMKGLDWRRLVRKTIRKSPSLAASAHAGSLSQESQLSDPDSSKKASQEASKKVSLAVETLESSRSSTAPRRHVVDEDEHGKTKLHHVCEQSHFWAVQVCLDKTPPDGKVDLLTHEDSAGKLPIHYAASNRSPNIIKLLVDNFPLPLKPTFLVARQDHAGRTPLHVASQHGHIGAIKCLLGAHQDPVNYVSTKDREGKTAQDLARDNDHPQACELLEETEKPIRRRERLATGL